MYAAGSTAVVTGAAGGIGRALTDRLAAEGFRLVLADLDPGVEALAASVGAVAVVGDCATEAGVSRLVETAWAELGRVDVFFANAGTDVGRGLDTPDAEWATGLEVNVMAHVRAARLLVPHWLDRAQPQGDRTESGVRGAEPRGDRTESEVPAGRFVVTASAAGLLTMLGSAPYSVSKHGAVAFAEWLRATYAHRGLTVQALCPQGVRTDMLMTGGDSAGKAQLAEGALEPDEVAAVVAKALEGTSFLILPHPEAAEYYRLRATETDRWLGGMNKIQRSFDKAGLA